MKFSYIYFSNPTVLTPVEFLQCLYQETISLVREPQKLLSTNISDKRVSNVSMNLLVLLYECQPHRNTAKEAKIRIDKSTWIELKSRPQTTHLLQQHAYVLVVSSYLVAGPAAAQKNLEIRSKRPLTRAHMSQTYGYALNLGTSPEAAVDRDRRKRARELVAKAEAVREVGSFDSLDQSFREYESRRVWEAVSDGYRVILSERKELRLTLNRYRVSRAALRDHGLTLPGRIVPSFAVDARARFDEFTVSKKR
uniref:Uncharacterized protein n=1 Tax=Rhodosorus marinus TaxID=101924 RepID=A0A7S0G1N5_9RHOD